MHLAGVEVEVEIEVDCRVEDSENRAIFESLITNDAIVCSGMGKVLKGIICD